MDEVRSRVVEAAREYVREADQESGGVPA